MKTKPQTGARAKGAAKNDQINELTRFVRQSLSARSNRVKAVEMAAYMKTAAPFYGVPQPGREAIRREMKARLTPSNDRDYQRAVLSLWRLEHREEKYLALAVAQMYPEFIRPQSLPLYEQLIRQGAWWDFVDEIAARIIGPLLVNYPAQVWPAIDRWIDDEDLWIRRTAIICQLKHKQRTDHVRLFRYCLARAGDQDFFIRKGIGWALRQYSYTAPERVRRFLLKNRDKLSPLSYREGSKVMIRAGLMLPD